MRPHLLLFLGLLSATLEAAPYRLEEIPLPPQMSPEVSAMGFSPSGRLVVANRRGEVWTCDPAKRDWRQFASGLHEPLGLSAVSDNEIYVAQRPEVTRLKDTTGDGVADEFVTVNGEWGITDNWHEFTFGLPRDKEGNFFVALGLPDTAGPLNLTNPRTPVDMRKVHKEAKPSPGLWQGWVLKITPDGKAIPWASGFRQACGVAVSPEGEVFVTDQQGDYIAASPLIHVQKGRFYGHAASLKWSPEFRNRQATTEELEALRTPPTVVLPHGSMGGSPGEPVWDTTGGKFGPFGNQVFIGDFTKLISRVDLEKVGGEYQGACFPFLRDATGLEMILQNRGSDNLTIPAGGDGRKYFRDAAPLQGTRLRQGNMRLAFAPDGSLYLGQTTRGWASGDGIQRLVWTGETPVEIQTMRLTERGFALTFTTPMDVEQLSNPQNYHLQRFRYLYQSAYGSPRTDEEAVAVRDIQVSEDGRRVELALSELEPGFIYEMELENMASREGHPVANPLAYYTLNRLHSGRTFTGPLGRPLKIAPAKKTADAKSTPDLVEGRRVYAAYCVTCHQANGRGGGVPGLAAADFVSGPQLLKSDEELLRSIENGIEGKSMPPFGQVISAKERRDVLAFIRDSFGKKPEQVSLTPRN